MVEGWMGVGLVGGGFSGALAPSILFQIPFAQPAFLLKDCGKGVDHAMKIVRKQGAKAGGVGGWAAGGRRHPSANGPVGVWAKGSSPIFLVNASPLSFW